MRNIKLTVSYDGAGYHGWQRQENALSVQEVLERAIARCTNEKVNLIGCGRTDTGVHAKAYICNFHTESKIPAERVVYAINAGLPDDIACLASPPMQDIQCPQARLP